MGYMDISIVGSDTASDFAFDIGNVVAKMLEKERKSTSNEFNTPGWLNAVLIFEAMIVPSPDVFLHNEKINKVAIEVFGDLDKDLSEKIAWKLLWKDQQSMRKRGEKILKKDEVDPWDSSYDSTVIRLSRLHRMMKRFLEDNDNEFGK